MPLFPPDKSFFSLRNYSYAAQKTICLMKNCFNPDFTSGNYNKFQRLKWNSLLEGQILDWNSLGVKPVCRLKIR